jgi:dihydropteroate synthase
VPGEQERDRVLPVIEGLRSKLSIPISIDTSKSIVAAAAIAAGAEIVNDVTGLEGDPQMADLVVSQPVGVCVMHMQGTPQTMQDHPSYHDVVQEIHDYLTERLRFCLDLGIPQSRICLDPGIGFGKTHEHNLELVRSVRRFLDIGCPLLVGHSRKGFIAHVLGDKQADRTAATLGVSLALATAGVDVLRVHDVKPTADALRLFEASGGLDPSND